MRFKRFIPVIIYLLLGVISVAQEIELPFTGELNIVFDKEDRGKLTQAVISIQEGKVKLAESMNMYENLEEEDRKESDYRKSKEMKEVYKKFEDAIKSFDNGYIEVYDIYKKNCNKFWDEQRENNHYATGLEKAKYYERMATRSLGRGHTRRGDAKVAKKFKEAHYLTTEANSYFFQAMRSQGRALQIYQDYPVEYNYDWENDIDMDKIIAKRKGKVIEEAQIDTSIQEFRRDTNMQDTKIVYIHDTIFIILKDSLDYADTNITFRVQIAAHTEPLSQDYLRTIYFGSRDIFELQEEGWYKYSIGIFKDYHKAKNVMEQSGVKKAFIVPYVEGKKIPVREALSRLGIKPEEISPEP